MDYRWVLRPTHASDAVDRIRHDLNDLPEALARALVLRGIDTFEQAKDFFRPTLSGLHDPFDMADMHAASHRLIQALECSERILVYGDYDVDGTTATALLVASLRALGGDVLYHVPDRVRDGYGLNVRGIDLAAASGATLIVAVDCGVTAVEEARYADGLGLDLVICDHHTPGATLPAAVAVLDPKRSDCPYPFRELSGCGVAFKLLQAVYERLGRPPEELYAYLDLVAVATACDVVPARGENRILMRAGLDALRTLPRLGLRLLADVAQVDLTRCDATGVAFTLGPRINAAGRLGSAARAVELLLEDDESRATEAARELDRVNQQRRHLDTQVLDEALRMADRHLTSRTRHAIVLHHEDWHLGVLGIVASRLVERFHRPTVLLGTNDGVAKGSVRSIAGLNVYDSLHACRHLLLHFGGHDYAAGLTLPLDRVVDFQDAFDEVVGRALTPEMLQPAIHFDAHVRLEEVDPRFWAVLKQFAPFGPDNEPPVFQASGLELAREPRTVGRTGSHLKFSVCRNAGAPVNAIGFGLGPRLDVLERSWRSGTPIDVLFTLDENTWNGRTTLQMKAADVRCSAPS